MLGLFALTLMSDEIPTKEINLTLKQRLFVDAYVGKAKGNATAATRLAGYAGDDDTLRSVASENLTKPNIKAAIAKRTHEFAMSPEEILAELADIGRNSSIVPLLDPKVFGKPTLLLTTEEGELKPEARFVKSVTVTDDSVKVEVYDRVAALMQLGKYHGLWVERHEHSGSIGSYAIEIGSEGDSSGPDSPTA